LSPSHAVPLRSWLWQKVPQIATCGQPALGSILGTIITPPGGRRIHLHTGSVGVEWNVAGCSCQKRSVADDVISDIHLCSCLLSAPEAYLTDITPYSTLYGDCDGARLPLTGHSLRHIEFNGWPEYPTSAAIDHSRCSLSTACKTLHQKPKSAAAPTWSRVEGRGLFQPLPLFLFQTRFPSNTHSISLTLNYLTPLHFSPSSTSTSTSTSTIVR
jgi:hypothetical protein